MTAKINMGPHGVDCAGCAAVAGRYCTKRNGQPRMGYCRERWDAARGRTPDPMLEFRRTAIGHGGRRRGVGVGSHAKVDPRRDSMIWLMRQSGAYTYRALGKLFGISTDRVRQIVGTRDREIRESSAREVRRPSSAATRRLIAAGAIADLSNGYEDLVPFPFPHDEQRELARQAKRARLRR